MISQMAQLPKKAESEMDQIIRGKSVYHCKIQAQDGLKIIFYILLLRCKEITLF